MEQDKEVSNRPITDFITVGGLEALSKRIEALQLALGASESALAAADDAYEIERERSIKAQKRVKELDVYNKELVEKLVKAEAEIRKLIDERAKDSVDIKLLKEKNKSLTADLETMQKAALDASNEIKAIASDLHGFEDCDKSKRLFDGRDNLIDELEYRLEQIEKAFPTKDELYVLTKLVDCEHQIPFGKHLNTDAFVQLVLLTERIRGYLFPGVCRTSNVYGKKAPEDVLEDGLKDDYKALTKDYARLEEKMLSWRQEANDQAKNAEYWHKKYDAICNNLKYDEPKVNFDTSALKKCAAKIG